MRRAQAWPARLRRLAAGLALGLAGAQAAPVSHVFLVQNSGWMEPFFSDPASSYKALVTELALAATGPGDDLLLAAFNQSLPGAPSPRALLSIKVEPASLRARLDAALAGLEPARKPGTAVLADTDLSEAVRAAIGSALGSRPGLVWLFTNNRNSPNNDQATARRNREFYALIHHGEAIRQALAFPLRMPVRGAHYRAGGLMVYVFAIGAQGARELDALLASGRVQRLITERPARLKPLDRDTVRLRPVKVEHTPGVRLSLAPGGALRADVEAGARAPAAAIEWRLENAIYPYTIVSARLAARATLAGQAQPVRLGSDQVQALAPGAGVTLAAQLQLPVAGLPGKWSLAALRAAGSAYVLPGAIEVRLGAQQLALSQAFRQRMAVLFPGDPLPDVFTPPAQMQGALAVLPLDVRVHFGLAPLLGLIGAASGLLALAGGAWLAATRPRRVRLWVDGEARTLSARAGTTQALYDRAGNQVADLHSTFWGNRIINLREGAQVRLAR